MNPIFTFAEIREFFEACYGRELPNCAEVLRRFHERNLVRLCVRHDQILGGIVFRKICRKHYNPADPYQYEPCGDTLFIVEAAALDKQAMRILIEAAEARCGQCLYIAFQRGDDKPVRFYDSTTLKLRFFGGQKRYEQLIRKQ